MLNASVSMCILGLKPCLVFSWSCTIGLSTDILFVCLFVCLFELAEELAGARNLKIGT